jgi:two-component system chemotaxis response regulator CheY
MGAQKFAPAFAHRSRQPRAERLRAALKARTRPSDRGGFLQALAALRILVIDDNEQMRTIIGTVLAAAGIRQLFYAPDGRRGFEVVSQTPIDAVYVDQEMPVMNGLDFISAVRRLESKDRYMPIVMLTGHSERGRAESARDRGVTEFLCKPVTANCIVGRLNAIIMNPRSFVEAGDYFGPDRRRRQTIDYRGPLRRTADRKLVEAIPV